MSIRNINNNGYQNLNHQTVRYARTNYQHSRSQEGTGAGGPNGNYYVEKNSISSYSGTIKNNFREYQYYETVSGA
jgi:hypothetical protein